MTEVNGKISAPVSSLSTVDARKKVTFSDVDVLATYYDERGSSLGHGEPQVFSSTPSISKNWKVRERRSQASLETDFRGRYLSIQPGDELVFENNPEKESSDVIRLVNVTSGHVAFKVKTTAPEKFRVRPSFGCIESGGSKTVEVSVQPGFLTTAQRDKFLVMSVPLENEPKDHNELVDYWHLLLKDGGGAGIVIDEHRLKCAILPSPAQISSVAENGTDNVALLTAPTMEKLDSMSKKLDYLLAAQKESQSRSANTQWNILTLSVALLLIFFCSRLLLFVFGTDDVTRDNTKFKQH